MREKILLSVLFFLLLTGFVTKCFLVLHPSVFLFVIRVDFFKKSKNKISKINYFFHKNHYNEEIVKVQKNVDIYLEKVYPGYKKNPANMPNLKD